MKHSFFPRQKGYVPVWAAVPYGVLGAGLANYATKLKFVLGIDDALDIFAVHGVGGLVGNLCTGLFASRRVAHLDGAQVIAGGWLDRHWVQLAYQLADSACGGAYSFAVTCLILLALNVVPGLQIRADEDAEILGIDDTEIGEFAYDYVELTREVPSDVDADVAAAVAVAAERDAMSRYSDATSTRPFDPREKHSIPLANMGTYPGRSSVPRS